MADLPLFQFTTQEDWYWEIPFLNADAAGAPLPLVDANGVPRVFEALITPATQGSTIADPVATLTMGASNGITFKDSASTTLVFRLPKVTARTFARGEFTADILEVVGGERHLFMPVRVRYGEPSSILSFLSRMIGVTFSASRQPIVTPVAIAGRQGPRGNGILSGSRLPKDADGLNDDFWIDISTDPRVLFGPKVAGKWPTVGTPITSAITPEMRALRDDAAASRDSAHTDATATASDRTAVAADRVTVSTKAGEVEAGRSEVSTNRKAVADDLTAANAAKDASRASSDTSTAQAALSATARTAAETARDGAQTARDTSVTARDASVAARDAAALSRDAATTARTGSETARDLSQSYATQAGVSANVAMAKAGQFATLAALRAITAPTVITAAEVVADGTNNGSYQFDPANSAAGWVFKSSATVSGLNAATEASRYGFQYNSAAGAFDITDDGGNVILRVDAAGGLQTMLATIGSLVASNSVTAPRLVTSAGHAVSDTAASAVFDVGDELGNVLARFDTSGLTLSALIAAVASVGTLDLGTYTISASSDQTSVLAVTDPTGWVLAALTSASVLNVGAVQTKTVQTGSADYSTSEIAQRDAGAIAKSASVRYTSDTTSPVPSNSFNQIIVYGQSIGSAEQAHPVKTVTGRSDVLMVGQSTRPGGSNQSATAQPLGDAQLRPAVATCQVNGTGALIDTAGQAALPTSDNALGEDPAVGGMLFARRMYLQTLGVSADDARKWIVSNVAVGGRSVEELSKGHASNLWSRVPMIANAAKAAAVAAGGTFGITALFWLQGEWNYLQLGGSSNDKATYKTNLKKLYNDFVSDISGGIAGQSEPPVMITYITSGPDVRDNSDMSIAMAQYELSLENPSWYIAAPHYPLPDRGSHLIPNSSWWLGLQFGKVFHQVVVLRRQWRPTSPLQATVRGRTVLIDYHVPCPPLQFRPCYDVTTPRMFADRGFTVTDDAGIVALSSVSLVGSAVVQIKLTRDPVGTVNVFYARKDVFNGGGNVCDSDPTRPNFSYDYQAGSGEDPSENIAEFAGLPYPLWNWSIPFKISAIAN